MSTQIFQPYFEELDQKAASFFATEHKEDFLKDLVFNEMNLINEAFDDLNALMAYRNTINTYGTLSNEQFGFIAGHINSLEAKYKGLISVETLVSESHNSDKKATIVSEAISTRTGLLIAGIITAIIGMIAWLLGKGKEDSAKAGNKATATIAKTEEILKKAPKKNSQDAEAKKQMDEQNAARKKAADEEIATDKAIADLNKALQEKKDAKEKERLEERRRLLHEKIERLAKQKRQEDELGAAAPNFNSFESTSMFLQQFANVADPSYVTYNEVDRTIKRFYEYSCELSDVIRNILHSTKRYSEDILEIFKIADKGDVPSKYVFESVFVGSDPESKKDTNQWQNVKIENELKEFNHFHDNLWKYINDDYASVMGSEIVGKINVLHGCPHSIQFILKVRSKDKAKKKTFKLLEDIEPYECHLLNEKCKVYTTDSGIVINTTKSAFKEFQNELKMIKMNTDRVKKQIDLYTKTGLIGKLNSEHTEHAMGFVSAVLKDVRSNTAFVTKLEKMLEKQLQECCDFVNAVARNAVKRDS